DIGSGRSGLRRGGGCRIGGSRPAPAAGRQVAGADGGPGRRGALPDVRDDPAIRGREAGGVGRARDDSEPPLRLLPRAGGGGRPEAARAGAAGLAGAAGARTRQLSGGAGVEPDGRGPRGRTAIGRSALLVLAVGRVSERGAALARKSARAGWWPHSAS